MMSADCSPVCGLAYTMLSIFTASTGPSALTGSPVNGSSSGPLAGAGAALGRAGDGAGVAAVLAGAGAAPDVQAVTASTVIAARPRPMTPARCRRGVTLRGPRIGPPFIAPVPGLPGPRNAKRETRGNQLVRRFPPSFGKRVTRACERRRGGCPGNHAHEKGKL